MGLFQYNRLVFGITLAPAIWQRTIDQVLEGASGTSCILDDMIITGKNDEEHLANLEEVLWRLQFHGLRANKAKCEFFKEKITYCGHDIDKDGLHKSAAKVEAVLKIIKWSIEKKLNFNRANSGYASEHSIIKDLSVKILK